jgi:hypothetical protein
MGVHSSNPFFQTVTCSKKTKSCKMRGSLVLSQLLTVQPHDSPFWRGLMKLKEEFFKRVSFVVNKDASTRFWEDTWLGNRPLAAQYSLLIQYCKK